jgi:MFS family permease
MTHGTAGDFPAEAMARRKMTTGEMITLSLLWFPMNMFWTAMLTYILPKRVEQLVGGEVKGEYLGYISIAGAVASTLIQLAIAPVSDACASKWGRRRPFIFWGMILNLLAGFGFALTGQFPVLLLCYFGIQIAQNAASAPYQALLPDNIHPSQQGISSAYMGGALLVGQLCGALILIAGGKLGIPGMLYIMLALMLLAALIVVWRVPDRPATPKEQKPLSESLSSAFHLNLREYPDFARLMGSRFFINLCYNTITAYLLYYIQDTLGLGENQPFMLFGTPSPLNGSGGFLNLLLLTATLAGLVGTVGAGYGLKKFTMKQMVYISCGMLAVAALVFSTTSGPSAALIMGFLFGAGWGVFQAVDWALAVNLLPPGGAARYMAIWHLCLILPQVIAPMFGKLWDSINKAQGNGYGWRMAFLVTVVYLFIGVFIIRKVCERPTYSDI